ncbi:MAG: glycosyltransferase family 4 protein [Candidatus Acidiferrum sp.]
MKIVQIVTQMESGGAQRVAYLLHQAFARRGHDAQLCFLYKKRPAYENESGITCLCDHPPKALDYVRIFKALRNWIHRFQPDAVVTHTHYANILGLTVARFAGVKIRIAVQHSPVQTFPGTSQYADWLCGNSGMYTNQVAVSDAVVKSMETYPPRYRRLVRRIYNGIEMGAGQAQKANLEAALPNARPRILHVGRFAAPKNHDALLEVLTRTPGAHLVLVGDGERKDEVKRRVLSMNLHDRVTFLGEICPEGVRAAMRSCDLFLFPSTYEAMPMALLEAMAAGMPIVASDIPANRELLEGAGLLREPDPEQLSRATKNLLADSAFSSELGKRAAERASKFTVAAMAEGYEQILQGS